MAGFIFLIAAIFILPYIVVGIYMAIVIFFGGIKLLLDKSNKNYQIRQEEKKEQQKALAEKNKEEKSRSRVNKLRVHIDENSHDLKACFELADLLYSLGDVEDAIDKLLFIVSSNKDWENGRARKRLLAILDELGENDPTVIRARYQLTSILFV